MEELDLIRQQFRRSQEWTLKLVEGLDEQYWKQTPPEVNSNINWQVGHITTSLYFQALVCIGGSREKVKNEVPVQEYISLYKRGTGAAERLGEKPGKAELLQAMATIFQEVERALTEMEPGALNEPVAVSHPLAKTKREVLSWCSHHQMWHNGIISLLRRLLTGQSI
ncbi:DinB family protein [Nafulsella turpanensis]|uniref:DinB family protein n=1 Tax=Nafulsella turpanensis TaxID=1265690 RepID=UPI001268C7A1|nr:DinB family protein [Nafulsella turpanensis]